MDKFATILIATHQYGKWLERAIISAINQTYQNLAICVIDDGSTDNTTEVIEAFLKDIEELPTTNYKRALKGIPVARTTLPFFSLFNETPKGPSAARNSGIKATWDFTDVYFVLDADDYMHDTKVEKFMAKFNDPNVGIVYGDYDTFDGSLIDNKYQTMRTFKEAFSKKRLYQECIIHSGAAFSKEALKRIGIKEGDPVFDESMRTAEDWFLWLKIAKSSIAFHIPESLTMVRIHENNSTNSVNKEIWNKNWIKIRDAINNGEV